jgi:hypothetical protein
VRRSLALFALGALVAPGALAGCAPGVPIARRTVRQSSACTACAVTAALRRGDFDFVANTSQLIARGFVVPGDAAHSEIVLRVETGEMPPPGVGLASIIAVMT